MLVLIIAGSLAARLQQIGRSLWLDEAWVANSVLADSWREMFYYERWLQTTPPGFLVLARAFTRLIPPTDVTLRLLPILLGVAGMTLFALLSVRVFPGWLAVAATALLSFSPTFLTYSQEFKHYSADVASATAMLLATALYMERPDRKRFGWLVAVCAVSIVLSYVAIMVVPAAAFAVLAARRSTLFRSALLGIVVGAIGGGCYLLLIRPNSSPDLTAFWLPYFPPVHAGVAGVVRFYLWAASGLAGLVPGPNWPFARQAAIVLLLLAGAAAIRMRGETSAHYRRWMALSLLPFLAIFALSALRLYPIGQVRLDVFLLPPLVLLLASAAGCLWQATSRFVRPLAPGYQPWVAAAVALAIAGVSAAFIYGMNHRSYEYWHDAEGALRHIRQQARPGDVVYLHATISEQARLYRRLWGWNPQRAALGDTGWPCCPRGKTEDHLRRDRGWVVGDFESRVLSLHPRRIWLAFAEERDVWHYYHRREATILSGLLKQQDCVETPQPVFHNTQARLFTCPEGK